MFISIIGHLIRHMC